MGLYRRFLLPRLLNLACSQEPIAQQRAKVVPLVRGHVLEVGFGSGLNLPFYEPGAVAGVYALEPDPEMLRLGRTRIAQAALPLTLLNASAEAIPLDDLSVDSVLVTYTLCTLRDVPRALVEMRRVLKPGGQLVFCEHGAAPDPAVRRWQARLSFAWKALGGCHLDRPIPSLLEQGGFRIAELSSSYIPGWRPASFNYWGRARHP